MVVLDKQFSRWIWYTDVNVKAVYLHLLLEADENGEVLTSVRKLASETGSSIQSVRTALKKLESTQDITQYPTHRMTVINISNYLQYAGKKKKTNTAKTKKPTQRFVPPTLDEVTEYIDTMMYTVRAEKFYDYYTEHDWKAGRYKIKDWKKKVDEWQENDTTIRPRAEKPKQTSGFASLFREGE